MSQNKRYYWIKLKESFMTSDAVDFLMSQPDGANYVVLYQMLCLKTINTGGRLERHIGEVIIPYDEAKIQRDTKYFTIDTVRVALTLYKSLGLIYVDNDGALCLTDHENLVGSETTWAIQKRNQRTQRIEALTGGQIPPECPTASPPDVPEPVRPDIDIRDRDKSIEIDTEQEEKEHPVKGGVGGKRKAKEFVPPTLEEVQAYCKERNSSVDPKQFHEYFTVGDWKDSEGKPVKNWKQKLLTWEKMGSRRSGGTEEGSKKPFKYDYGNDADTLPF